MRCNADTALMSFYDSSVWPRNPKICYECNVTLTTPLLTDFYRIKGALYMFYRAKTIDVCSSALGITATLDPPTEI